MISMILVLPKKKWIIQTQTTLNHLFTLTTNPIHQVIFFFSASILYFRRLKGNFHLLVPYGDASGAGDSEFFLHVHPDIKDSGTPDFKLSNCKVHMWSLHIKNINK